MKQYAVGFAPGKILLGLGLILLTAGTAAAAEITVPKLEMDSRGRMVDEEFVLSSFFSADIALSGGNDYAFLLGFSAGAGDIAKAFAYRNFTLSPLPSAAASVDPANYNALVDRINNQAYIGFRVAQATAREIFGLPLDFSFFFGEGDDFGTGDEFPALFGVSPFDTDFRGFFYFPEGIGEDPERRYNGIYGVRGTGFSLHLTKWERFVPSLYVYQDFAGAPLLYNPGANSGVYAALDGDSLYSGDLRLLFHYNWLRVETFGGVSLNPDLDISVRGGIMAHLAGNGAEFFVQGGVPGFTMGKKFSIDNVFFLMEPRLRFENFGVHVTFFYHPVEYLHIITEKERGIVDLNVKFLFGKEKSGITGGIEAGGELKIGELSDYVLRIAPFASFFSGGLRWDLKLRILPLEYDSPEEMVEIFLGVRTAF